MFFFKPNKKAVDHDTTVSPSDTLNEHNSLLSYGDLNLLFDYIRKQTGINLYSKEGILREKLQKFCSTRNINSFDALFARVRQEQDLRQELMDFISINETYFFREIKSINESIKKLKNRQPPYRILSAPVSTGEEAYTILILMLEQGFQAEDIHILGVDISRAAIEQACRAVYSKRSLHKLPSDIKSRYFYAKDNEHYSPVKQLKKNVEFKHYNIFEATPAILGRFDIIFSRNMFIYFDDEQKINAYQILSSLKKDANSDICLGHADVSSQLYFYIRSIEKTGNSNP